jgi:hypothetical protein
VVGFDGVVVDGDFQGLAAHWPDEYHQSTPLQELDVTGLPEGEQRPIRRITGSRTPTAASRTISPG